MQSTHLVQNLPKLTAAYGVIYCLLMALGLVLEHDKSEVYHFSWVRGESHPPIDLGFAPYTRDTPLGPKLYWHYLGSYFDHTLSFREHIQYYSTKAMMTVRALGMLGNSSRGVSVVHKYLLYRTCVVPMAMYGLRLWYLQGSHLKGVIKQLLAVQHLVALWITGCFKTSPVGGMEALEGLLPMHILLWRLVQYFTVPLVVCMDSTRTAQTVGNLSKVCTESKQSAWNLNSPWTLLGLLVNSKSYHFKDQSLSRVQVESKQSLSKVQAFASRVSWPARQLPHSQGF